MIPFKISLYILFVGVSVSVISAHLQARNLPTSFPIPDLRFPPPYEEDFIPPSAPIIPVKDLLQGGGAAALNLNFSKGATIYDEMDSFSRRTRPSLAVKTYGDEESSSAEGVYPSLSLKAQDGGYYVYAIQDGGGIARGHKDVHDMLTSFGITELIPYKFMRDTKTHHTEFLCFYDSRIQKVTSDTVSPHFWLELNIVGPDNKRNKKKGINAASSLKEGTN